MQLSSRLTSKVCTTKIRNHFLLDSRLMGTKTGGGVEVFDFLRIKQEILNNWLQAEHKASDQKTSNGSRNSAVCALSLNQSAYQKPSAKWYWLDRELSSNVAGETGAVYIYKGALFAMKFRTVPKQTRDFVSEHMDNEAEHLALFEKILPKSKVTSLLPIWRIAGWGLGFLPTLLGGSHALYVTVESVETFVEEHYTQQILPLKKAGGSEELVRLLEHCCADEVHHKEDASKNLLFLSDPRHGKMHGWWVKSWSMVVRGGSTIAAELARRI